MFCTKCGAQISGGTAFCPNCGAQLAVTPPVTPGPVPQSPAGGSGKKIALIIIAVVAVVIVMLAVLAAAAFVLFRGAERDSGRSPDVSDASDVSDSRQGEKDGADNDEPEPISLTQTFEAASEGFSFRCPSDWAEEDTNGVYSDAIISVAYTSASGITYGRIAVVKTENDGSLDDMTADDFEMAYLSEPNISDVDNIKLRDVKLDGRDAKKLTLTFTNDVDISCACVQYYYAAGSDIYIVTGIYPEDMSDKYGPVLDAIMDSYTITAPEPDPGMQELAAAKAAYADIVRTLASEDGSLTFDLINLTGSDIPELLAGMDGYYVSVYMWAGGEAVPVIDDWPYGAGGNYGYEYLPGQNIIRNFNSDMAGAIVYETYMTINAAYEAVSIWDNSLSAWYFWDRNGNYMIDEDEPFLDEPLYYYGDMPVTQEQYAAFQFPGDYQWMGGSMSASEVLELLGA